MISDKQIDKLIQKIVEYQEFINSYTLQLLGKRIKKIGELPIKEINNFVEPKSKKDFQKYKDLVKNLRPVELKAIQNLLKRVALDSYRDSKSLYDYRKIEYLPFDENSELKKFLDKTTEDTLILCGTILASTYFVIRDLASPANVISLSVDKTFRSVISEAVQVRRTPIDYLTGMDRTIKQLAASGLRVVDYNEGKMVTQKVDSAMRKTLLESVKMTQQGVQDVVAKQTKADGKEISVHIDSAPDHEPIQGHQFTDEEFEKLQSEKSFKDIEGNKFDSIRRAIGTWNCRHYTYAIIVGVTPPKYTKSALAETQRINHMGITLSNGKTLSHYECTQHQRYLERKIRGYKQQVILTKAVGDLKSATQYQNKINSTMLEYIEFSKEAELDPLFDRTTVSGYKALAPSELKY